MHLVFAMSQGRYYKSYHCIHWENSAFSETSDRLDYESIKDCDTILALPLPSSIKMGNSVQSPPFQLVLCKSEVIVVLISRCRESKK